ncbi:Gfo/Idh/MocA family oxidoreductase [Sporosarcina sp. E16_3]|uniref:Gfo/Idh/MocA family oxidoreductase n=1 Tax=Sporosarcina sp. E16_3 TaxID=2789293 RepID=UPI0031FCD937
MAVGMVTFKNGATLTLEAAFAANVEKDETMQVSLMGNRGGADIFPLKIYQEKYNALIDSTPAYVPEVNGHQLEINQFVECCLKGKISLSTPEQGLIIQKIVNAIYESAETGKRYSSEVLLKSFKPKRLCSMNSTIMLHNLFL